MEWGKRGCDTVLATGRAFSCGQVWGTEYLKAWRKSTRTVCDSKTDGSAVKCRFNAATGTEACIFENVAVDFSKAPVKSNMRSFEPGFLQASCGPGRHKSIPLPPGSLLSANPLPRCDIVEDKPSFFMSHDLIFNLGHTISDFWIVFVSKVLISPLKFVII